MENNGKRKDGSLSYLKYVLIIAALLAAMIAAVVLYYMDMNTKLMSEAHRNLKTENEYKEQYFSQFISSRMNWYRTVAAFCDVPEGSGAENWHVILKEYSSDDMRFGIADAHGRIYFGENQSADISGRDYYKKVMQGEEVISDVLTDSWDGQESVLMAVPIWKDGQVCGAVCAEYTTQNLGLALNTSTTEKAGATLVFDRTGKVVASYKGMENFSTIYDMLETMQYKEGNAVEKLKKEAAAGDSGFMTYYNNDKVRLFYYQPSEYNGWTICSLVVTDAEEKVLQELKATSLWMLAGVVAAVVLILLTSISGIRHVEKRVKKMQRDFLTGCYNRVTGKRIVEKGLHVDQNRLFGACLFIDVDNFKGINDTYGHDEGDRILIKVGQILMGNMRESDVVIRFGGDEFVIWMYRVDNVKVAEDAAGRILKAAYDETGISLSIGIAMTEPGEKNYDAVMKRADEALYRAKAKGKNQYAVYSEDTRSSSTSSTESVT